MARMASSTSCLSRLLRHAACAFSGISWPEQTLMRRHPRASISFAAGGPAKADAPRYASASCFNPAILLAMFTVPRQDAWQESQALHTSKPVPRSMSARVFVASSRFLY